MPKSKKILIVEDDMISSAGLKAVLKSRGYDVPGTVRDGASAIEYVSSHDPDLIIMDMKLDGDMSGLEAGKKIRELGKNTPIILFTGYAMDDNQKAAVNGIQNFRYLLKPFDEKTMLGKHGAIESALKGKYDKK